MPLISSSSFGIARTLDDRIAGLDLLALGHLEPRQRGHGVGVLGAVVGDDRDRATLALVVADAHHARRAGQRGLALRAAGLEELDDAGQTTGDVLAAGDTTRVEGTHGELGTRLTDGLGADDADRFTDLDGLARGQRKAVAGPADAVAAVVGER